MFTMKKIFFLLFLGVIVLVLLSFFKFNPISRFNKNVSEKVSFNQAINQKNMDIGKKTNDFLVEKQKVSFSTTDGVKIFGDYYGSSGSEAVLLIHQNGMNKDAWGELPKILQSRGFAVLAVDLRGHGESTTGIEITTGQTKIYDYKEFSDQDYFPAMTFDVVAARKFLTEKGKTKQSIVGASTGANLAIIDLAMHTEPADPASLKGYNPNNPTGSSNFNPLKIDPSGKPDKVVALSPGLNFKGIGTELSANNIKSEYYQKQDGEEIYRFASAPFLLLLTAKDDDYSYQSSKKIQEMVGEPLSALMIVPGDSHGVELVTNKTAVDSILDFLTK